ncbi:hypothetical protein Tco_0507969 [Tanacetum coccineum]
MEMRSEKLVADQNKGKTYGEVAAYYAEFHANVEEFCNESFNARVQIHTAINTIMKFIENEQKDHHGEHTSIIESLSKVQESLKEDFELKARLKTLVDTNFSNSNNMTEPIKLLREENVLGVMTILEAIQNIINNQNNYHSTLASSYKYLE